MVAALYLPRLVAVPANLCAGSVYIDALQTSLAGWTAKA
jgi:hypothetical protein